MPSNISFLESAREFHGGQSGVIFGSKVDGNFLGTAPTINPSNSSFTYHEAWMPSRHRNPLPHPFTQANGGTTSLSSNTIPPIGGTEGPVPILTNTQTSGNADAHTRYSGDQNYAMARKYPTNGYTDDVIWEISTYVRRTLGSTIGTVLDQGGNPNTSTIRAELFIFVMDGNYDVIFDSFREVTNQSTSVNSPSTGKYFYFTRSTDVGYNDWTKLEMFVKFPVDQNINFVTMRVDCDALGQSIAFANTRLQPHNMSFNKIFGGTGATANSNLIFSSFEV